MLVLSRRAGQSIHIGPDIFVHVLRINGQRVRIGIVAPSETKVRRSSESFPSEGGAVQKPDVSDRPAERSNGVGDAC